ncbi:hypothetical protein ACMD2_12606 [Ananas comosus]|uniref:Uncharacterized protein n=1 Tax=Ananas comosus TaxID=4615 RepID=A0A199UWS5_ANACO|nr:hypothetical protein ACMD2_26614 [Ananas comosus]OAY69253.1 hypothetical protein ACMD2_12606 [Ananas comosus]
MTLIAGLVIQSQQLAAGFLTVAWLNVEQIQESRALEKRDEQILLQRELLSVLETSSRSLIHSRLHYLH